MRTALQWGPTRGPGWSWARDHRDRRGHRHASVGPDPRAGMVARHVQVPRIEMYPLQWGPTRGPGWSREEQPEGRGRQHASVGPDPRAGMVAGRDLMDAVRVMHASVGPDPRAGMVDRAVSHGRCHTLASVGPDPRAGMVVPRRLLMRAGHEAASVGPDPRAGMVGWRRRPGVTRTRRFSGARPEGRDGRGCSVRRAVAAEGLQWGPTRGPGWSADGLGGLVTTLVASVGPDPRAGMVAGTPTYATSAEIMLQWGPTRGPGWSFSPCFRRCAADTCFSGARPEGRDGRT